MIGIDIERVKERAREIRESAECFEGLRDLGIVNDELASHLVKMVRFRNLLVHRYWEIDPVRVLGYAREDLGDFEAFLAAVEGFVKRDLEEEVERRS